MIGDKGVVKWGGGGRLFSSNQLLNHIFRHSPSLTVAVGTLLINTSQANIFQNGEQFLWNLLKKITKSPIYINSPPHTHTHMQTLQTLQTLNPPPLHPLRVVPFSLSVSLLCRSFRMIYSGLLHSTGKLA